MIYKSEIAAAQQLDEWRGSRGQAKVKSELCRKSFRNWASAHRPLVSLNTGHVVSLTNKIFAAFNKT